MTQENTIDRTVLAKERASRLKRLRSLANLSRNEFCDGAGININTYIGYEVARYGGLTKKGAEIIVKYLKTQGVYTSMDWIMFGVGPAPQVITEEDKIALFNDVEPEIIEQEQEFKNIAEEIYLFKKHYKNAIDFRVSDDGMSPIYDIGDYVAGIMVSGKYIDSYAGHDCIVKINDGEILVRNICRGRSDNKYTLSCNNPKTKVVQPVIHDIELNFVVPIIWHRRPYNKALTTSKQDKLGRG